MLTVKSKLELNRTNFLSFIPHFTEETESSCPDKTESNKTL